MKYTFINCDLTNKKGPSGYNFVEFIINVAYHHSKINLHLPLHQPIESLGSSPIKQYRHGRQDIITSQVRKLDLSQWILNIINMANK